MLVEKKLRLHHGGDHDGAVKGGHGVGEVPTAVPAVFGVPNKESKHGFEEPENHQKVIKPWLYHVISLWKMSSNLKWFM